MKSTKLHSTLRTGRIKKGTMKQMITTAVGELNTLVEGTNSVITIIPIKDLHETIMSTEEVTNNFLKIKDRDNLGITQMTRPHGSSFTGR
ncbi:hypothetical protein F2Q68_00019458 [Brassica cretica]|uniref:Uncharacterized protein n=2 Tax=Brassica cretica TaxID=69181 RepID=A0A8S9FUX5_BRACR|nr:hypothetical protein F2Q68_00019458 [Brassica cretica]KAF3563314.1 hypothetical protein DY000_02012322 [Brassica cretica]